jgi:hypothetical protein
VVDIGQDIGWELRIDDLSNPSARSCCRCWAMLVAVGLVDADRGCDRRGEEVWMRVVGGRIARITFAAPCSA